LPIGLRPFHTDQGLHSPVFLEHCLVRSQHNVTLTFKESEVCRIIDERFVLAHGNAASTILIDRAWWDAGRTISFAAPGLPPYLPVRSRLTSARGIILAVQSAFRKLQNLYAKVIPHFDEYDFNRSIVS